MIDKEKTLQNPAVVQETSIVVKVAGQPETTEHRSVVIEHSLDVILNGRPLLSLNCSPVLLEELVLGYLFSHECFQSIDEIESVRICKSGLTANVVLNRASGDDTAVFNAVRSVSNWEPKRHSKLKQIPCHFLNYDDIFLLSRAFHAGSPFYLATRGVHSSSLCIDGEITVRCEDIGRHNALDKVIGYTIKNRLDTSRATVFCSGRITADSVRKTIKCGFPVLVTNSVPSEQAIDLARRHKLTLLGEAKGDRLSVFSK